MQQDHIEIAKKGGIALDVKTVIATARQLSATNNWAVLQAILLIFSGLFIALFVVSSGYTFQTIEDVERFIREVGATFGFFQTIITAPLWTGVAMMAILSLRGQPYSIGLLIRYLPQLPMLGLAALLVGFAIEIGFYLLFVPGFYVLMATTFAMPLIADQGKSPLEAIKTSFQITNAYIFKIATIYLIIFSLFIMVLLSFGFAIIFVGAFYFNLKAVLYQTLCCARVDRKQDTPTNDDTGVFNA